MQIHTLQRLFGWLGWKGGLPSCVLLSATAASAYCWAYITLDTTCPGYWPEHRWHGASGAASAHFAVMEAAFFGFCLGVIVGLLLWRQLVAGIDCGLSACVLFSAMFTSVYFKALAILETQQPAFWAGSSFGQSDFAVDTANLGITFQTFFGFCVGAILGVLLWRLLVRLQRYQQQRALCSP